MSFVSFQMLIFPSFLPPPASEEGWFDWVGRRRLPSIAAGKDWKRGVEKVWLLSSLFLFPHLSHPRKKKKGGRDGGGRTKKEVVCFGCVRAFACLPLSSSFVCSSLLFRGKWGEDDRRVNKCVFQTGKGERAVFLPRVQARREAKRCCSRGFERAKTILCRTRQNRISQRTD